jgi:thiamine-monophosphate kinase
MSRLTPARIVPGELSLISSIRRKTSVSGPASQALIKGIGDDCALLRPRPLYDLCVTTDFSLEGVHFRRDLHPPQSVGHRCLARGLSDLAAMGAGPLAVFLSLALPARTPKAWLDGFLEGFFALAGSLGVPLAGGDTAQSPRGIAADVVAIGQIPRNAARLRSTAQPGDYLYVTGALGGSAAELLAIERNPRKFRTVVHAATGHPHLFPEPRIAVGRRLRTLTHAMIDISDGLSTDLTHLCEESGRGAILDEAALPIHPLAAQAEQSGLAASALELALHGGEDYELLFTAAPSIRIPRSLAGVPIHRIGALQNPVRDRPRIVLSTPGGRQIPLMPNGWEHFK